MPALSPTMSQGNLAKWHVKPGDEVRPGTVLADVETDKATLAFENQDEGFIAKLLVADGARDIPIGQPVAVLVEEAENIAAFANYTLGGTSSSATSSSSSSSSSGGVKGAAAAPAPSAAAPASKGAPKSYPPHIVSVIIVTRACLRAARPTGWWLGARAEAAAGKWYGCVQAGAAGQQQRSRTSGYRYGKGTYVTHSRRPRAAVRGPSRTAAWDGVGRVATQWRQGRREDLRLAPPAAAGFQWTGGDGSDWRAGGGSVTARRSSCRDSAAGAGRRAATTGLGVEPQAWKCRAETRLTAAGRVAQTGPPRPPRPRTARCYCPRAGMRGHAAQRDVLLCEGVRGSSYRYSLQPQSGRPADHPLQEGQGHGASGHVRPSGSSQARPYLNCTAVQHCS